MRMRNSCPHASNTWNFLMTEERLSSLLSHRDSIDAGLAFLLNEHRKTNDNRLLKRYLTLHPDCGHISLIFEVSSNEPDTEKCLLGYLCAEQILLLTASAPDEESTLRSVGRRLSLTLLSTHLSHFYSALSSGKPDTLSAAALKVLTAIVMQGNLMATELLNVFDFSLQQVQHLPIRSKQIKESTDSVRTCFIKFLLSFLVIGDSSVTCRVISMKKLFGPIFRYLAKDTSETVVMLVTLIKGKIVENRMIAKTTKVEFFDKFALESLSKILVQPDHRENGLSSLIQDLFLTLSTNSKVGIAFLSKTFLNNPNWTNNPSLLGLLTNLLPHLHDTATPLIIPILVHSPDLLLLFLRRALLSYDYKKNSQWKKTMEFTTELYSSLPSMSDLLNQCDTSVINQSNLSGCLAYCIPYGLNRSNITLLLLNSDHEVKKVTIKLLTTILERAIGVQPGLAEDGRSCSYFNDNVLKQLPDVRTLINVRQSLLSTGRNAATCTSKDPDAADDFELIPDLIYLLTLYQKLSPVLLYQADFNLASLVYELNDVSAASPVINHTLSLLLDAPPESLKKLMKPDIVHKVLNIMMGSPAHPSPASYLLVKCMRMHPLIAQCDSDMTLLLDIAYHHGNNSGSSVSIDTTRLTGVLMNVYRYQLGEGRRQCGCGEKFVKSVLDKWSLEELLDRESKIDVEFDCSCTLCETPFFPVAEVILMVITPEISDDEFCLHLHFFCEVLLKSCDRVSLILALCKQHTELDEKHSEDLSNENVPPVVRGLAGVVILLLSAASKVLTREHIGYIKTLITAGRSDDTETVLQIKSFYLVLVVLSHHLPEESVNVLVCYMLKELSKLISHTDPGEGTDSEELELTDCLQLLLKDRKVAFEYNTLSKQWRKLVRRSTKLRFNSPSLLDILSQLIPLLYQDSLPDDSLVVLKSLYRRVWDNLSLDRTISDCLQSLELEVVIIRLMVAMVQVFVDSSSSCCSVLLDSSHYQFFLGSYTATSSQQDRGLLYLMYLYEKSGVSMDKFNPVIWGPESLTHYSSKQEVSWLLWKQPTMHEIINIFDGKILSHSVDNFPLKVQLEPLNPWDSPECFCDGDSVVVYDPSFVLPRLSLLLDQTCEVDCRKFVSSSCLSYLIAATSALDDNVRWAAYHCLGRFESYHLHKAKMKGKRQLIRFVEVLHQTVAKENIRLPSVVSAFFIKALPIILDQDHALYSVVSSHLSRKFLVLKDIPLYSTLLFGSGTQYVTERRWMLQLLVRGLRCEGDYYLYKKKEVLPQLMSLYHCPFTPEANKCLILQVIHGATNILPTARDLVWNHGLFPWLHDLQQNNQHNEIIKIIKDNVDRTINSDRSSSVKIPLYSDDILFITK